MSAPLPELLQFPYSTYNEKARWALDLKRVPHTRRNLLPGPHAPLILRLTGKTTTPVMRFGGQTVAGSARIIDELEHRYPKPPLYPSDPTLRKKALDLQARFDDDLGPAVRRAVFSELLSEGSYVCGMFSEERGAFARALYRATFPLTRIVMGKSMGITGREAVERAFASTEQALDIVASESRATGFLVGGSFTVADLTAAALLAPAAAPPGSPMDLPHPRPLPLQRWLARWRDHPGTAWILERYRQNRPPSAEVA
jgi:glutathione S-transferase